MAHSYVSSVFHIVFSTKQRMQLIPADRQSRLWNDLAPKRRKSEAYPEWDPLEGEKRFLASALPSNLN